MVSNKKLRLEAGCPRKSDEGEVDKSIHVAWRLFPRSFDLNTADLPRGG